MTSWKSDALVLTLDEQGNCRLFAGETNIQSAPTVPVAQVYVKGRLCRPLSAHEEGHAISVDFGPAAARLHIDEREGYLRLTVDAVDDCVDDWIWGPYEVPFATSCGEIVGVAWGDGWAAGIQSLNPKTEGGYPPEKTDSHPFGRKIPNRKSEREPLSACAALPLRQGAVLQAFARNRTRLEYRPFLYAEKAMALPINGEDAQIAGSAVALFACPTDRARERIGKIEVAEHLPHPTIHGEWAKTSPDANESYLITDFSESCMEEAIRYAGWSGMRCLYHPEPFANWGHFELKKEDFPHGDAGLKSCAEQAGRAGMYLGLHTLSNFTTTDDPYVTPVPDPHLLKMGGASLTEPADAGQRTISLDSGACFERLSALNTVCLENELIRYTAVEPSGGGVCLTGCERGAWGTRAASHPAGTQAYRLWDHDYRTLFPDYELQKKFSRRLGKLLAETGVRRISFDGMEGCTYTGHGELAAARFVKDCYDLWGPEVRSDASRLGHYRWHMHTYMNWGEPWYADMRNSMFDLRRKNQAYFARNLLPAMMGWYTMRLSDRKYEATTVDDMEWMLAKAAGFGAGFAFSARMKVLRGHGMARECLKQIPVWERMRTCGQLPDELREELREPRSEWHLEEAGEDWLLHRVNRVELECSPEGAQPGMPCGADWMLDNPYAGQPTAFRFRAGDNRDHGAVVNPSFRLGGGYLLFRTRLEAGQYLLYAGGTEATVCDADFHSLSRVTGEGTPLCTAGGVDTLAFKCLYEGEEPPYPQMTVFMQDEGQRISCR